jgi:hypothetical protein
VEHSQNKSVTGWPALSHLPLLRYLFSGEDVSNSENEVLIVVTPKLVRARDFASETLEALSVGTDSDIELRPRLDGLQPVAQNSERNPIGESALHDNDVDAAEKRAGLRLDPSTLALKMGETAAVKVMVDNVGDLFSASLILQYDPQILSVEDIQHGDFLSAGPQEVAIVQRIDAKKGKAAIFTTRQPNTAGTSGNGVLMTIIVKRVADGPASLQLQQADARTSRQRAMPMRITGSTVALP